jgi:hypothetical protein
VARLERRNKILNFDAKTTGFSNAEFSARFD